MKLVSFVGEDDTDILPFFLRHYRSLGIAEFHLFLHGTWSSGELALLKTDGVVLAGIVQGEFDEVMKSSALQDYMVRFRGEWMVIADADEFLEVPYRSLAKTIRALLCLGLDELPATLLQRAAADGRLASLAEGRAIGELFPCYDYLLAERMELPHPIWKSKYPLVRVGDEFRLSRGHHLPHNGRPSAHVPIRGVVHHFKWRDRLTRSVARKRGAEANQGEQDAVRLWLERNGSRLPTDGLKPYSRSGLFEDGFLMRPNRSELKLFSALRRTKQASRRADLRLADGLGALGSPPVASAQPESRAETFVDRRGLLVPPGRIALVTAELFGLRRSGGIGTAMSALAERLSAAGHEVHVFLFPYADFPRLEQPWFDYWEARGISLHYFPEERSTGAPLSVAERSAAVCGALAAGDWDVIHFAEAGGVAAATLLARAAGLAFSRTQVAVTVHGPTRWHRQGNSLRWTDYEAVLAELEATSVNLADAVIFPSAYMMKWCEGRLPTAAPRILVPNGLTGESRRFGRWSFGVRPVEKIVFFGRMELRKGIDLFLSAIDLVLTDSPSGLEVIFLGSLSPSFSQSDLSRRTEEWPCRVQVLTNYTNQEALGFLRSENCIAVIPSRVDNSPYTVCECLENGIPFIAADVGGIAELIREEDRARVLVRGGAEEYAAKLAAALRNGASPARPRFDPTAADLDLLSLHGCLVAAARTSRGSKTTRAPERASVILHGPGADRLDRQVARVLQRWADEGAEILRCPSPIPSPESASAAGLSRSGAAATPLQAAVLNRLAASAEDALFFCHSSVAPRPAALSAMHAALTETQAYAVVCGYREEDSNGRSRDVPVFGGPPELSAGENVFGARLFLVRKDAFLEAGGFTEDPALADILEWEFLNRLKAAGRRIVGIPVPIALYRGEPAPSLDSYQQNRLAAPWIESAPEHLQPFVRMALLSKRDLPTPDALGGGNWPSEAQRDPGLRELLQLRAAAGSASARMPVQSLAATVDGESRVFSRVSGAGAPSRAVPGLDGAKPWASDSPLDSIEPGESEPDAWRLLVGADGRLLSDSYTYVVQSAEDAEDCDFLVRDDGLDASLCEILSAAYRDAESRILGAGAEDARTGGFLWIEELLTACPDCGHTITEAVRRALQCTAEFYRLTAPLHPELVRITEVAAGGFVPPPMRVPQVRATLSSPPQPYFSALACLGGAFEGGECYFTSLDLAVEQRRGRLIACLADPYHERAVLRVESGSVLMLSLSMSFSADHLSRRLRKLGSLSPSPVGAGPSP